MGTKLAALVHNPWCAFEVDEVHGLLDWTSVVVKGSFYLLDPESASPDTYARARHLMTLLIPGTFAADDPVPHRTVLFGIYVQELSGRAAVTSRQ
jgi:nitroimidazol reductase NimA-like FMN-containing flavoprotein (pyridoxamine 5'-phosphate oxidase superfamily)